MKGYVKIRDVVQPELFAKYVIDRTTEKNEIMFAGVVENEPELNRLISGGGSTFTMPKWNDLDGDSEVLSDVTPMKVNGINAKSEVATLLIRGKSWSANELAGAFAGDDPMRAIGNLVADFWVRDEKKNVLSIMNGVFASPSMAQSILDITSATSKKISTNAVLDAKQLLGDAAENLTMLYMHSATFTELQKQNVIQFIPASESRISIPTYLGYRVVTDDSCPMTPANKAVYTITFAGNATIGQTITIDGVVYTALSADSPSTIATKMKELLEDNGTFGGNWKISQVGAVLTCVWKASGTATAPVATSSTGATATATVAKVTDGYTNPVYTTYLMAAGCIRRGIGVPVSLTPVETDRDSLQSNDILINRQAKVLHPAGVSWVGQANILGATPTNDELASGLNWSRVSETKKVRMVKLVHTLV